MKVTGQFLLKALDQPSIALPEHFCFLISLIERQLRVTALALHQDVPVVSHDLLDREITFLLLVNRFLVLFFGRRLLSHGPLKLFKLEFLFS
jgi:hypothetical protein